MQELIISVKVITIMLLFLLIIWKISYDTKIKSKLYKTFHYYYHLDPEKYGGYSLVIYENIEGMSVTHNVIPVTKFTNIHQEIDKVKSEWKARGYHITLKSK